MKRTFDNNAKTGALGDDYSDVILGRPTVAANNGMLITSGLRRRFEEAGLGDAEWIRLPKPGARCRLSSLSRTSLNEAVARGEIRSITVRQPGSTRGIKLLNKASLAAWLNRLDQEQNGPGTQPAGGAHAQV